MKGPTLIPIEVPSPMHKNTKLLPYQRREAYRRWLQGDSVTDLAHYYRVSRQTLYETFKKAKLGIFENYTSANKRYRTVEYGLKHLSKVEAQLAKKLAKRERRKNRYEKDYPGEMVHFDTKKLPVMRGESIMQPREWLHVAIDDHSRLLVADILPDKTAYSSAIHLEETIMAMPFPIECAYSDNGSEYKGKADHPFVMSCSAHGIDQKFTRPRTPRTNGKAERVIRTIMDECFRRSGRTFPSREHRRRYLYAFVRWYNQVRPHESLDGQPPITRLESYLARVKEEVEMSGTR